MGKLKLMLMFHADTHGCINVITYFKAFGSMFGDGKGR